jgi:hypothetical protein
MFSNSLTFVFRSLPIPKGTQAYGGVAMGFEIGLRVFLEFNLGFWSFYNCALSLYFYKSLCFNMKDEQIAKGTRIVIYRIHCVVFGDYSCGFAARLVQSQCGLLFAPEPSLMPQRDDIDCIQAGMQTYAAVLRGFNFSFFNYLLDVDDLHEGEESLSCSRAVVGMEWLGLGLRLFPATAISTIDLLPPN